MDTQCKDEKYVFELVYDRIKFIFWGVRNIFYRWTWQKYYRRCNSKVPGNGWSSSATLYPCWQCHDIRTVTIFLVILNFRSWFLQNFVTLKDKESMFLKEMKRYSIPRALLTDLYMYQRTIASQNTMLGIGLYTASIFWDKLLQDGVKWFKLNRKKNFIIGRTHMMCKGNYEDKFERYQPMMTWVTFLIMLNMETSHLSLSHRNAFI